MSEWLLLAAELAAAVFALKKALPWLGAAINWRKRKQRRHGGARGTKDGREPLRTVVARCEAAWFLEDLRAAMLQGDEVAMERVGHMLLAGYGSKQDPHEAAKWLREAWAIQNYREIEESSMAGSHKPVPAVTMVDGHAVGRAALAAARAAGSLNRHESSIPQLHATTTEYCATSEAAEDAVAQRRMDGAGQSVMQQPEAGPAVGGRGQGQGQGRAGRHADTARGAGADAGGMVHSTGSPWSMSDADGSIAEPSSEDPDTEEEEAQAANRGLAYSGAGLLGRGMAYTTAAVGRQRHRQQRMRGGWPGATAGHSGVQQGTQGEGSRPGVADQPDRPTDRPQVHAQHVYGLVGFAGLESHSSDDELQAVAQAALQGGAHEWPRMAGRGGGGHSSCVRGRRWSL